ncbi:MAG: hypothetical protein JNL69_09405 [Bacteroidia bacterium]|nr:hypothetical protein [Bacteroidia bacterium]
MFNSSIKSAFSRLVQNIKKPLEEKKLADFIHDELHFIQQQIPNNTTQKKGTAIIKCDDIGDFLMWQQVIPFIKQHAEKPICFIGNKALQSLIESKFNFADAYIWVDKKKWGNKEYRIEQYKAINKLNVNIATTTLFTRHLKLDDLLLYASNANQRIAWNISHHAYFPKIKNIDQITTQTIKTDIKIELEYFRNIEFINKLYNANLPKEINPLYNEFKKQNKLAVVPLGNIKSKCWHADNYVQTLKSIESYFESIVILGGTDGIETGDYISQRCNSTKIQNLCGKTSIEDLFTIIGESQLVLCPDTSTLHIAVQTNTNVVLLSNGTNWQRFTNYAPYTKNKISVIYPPHFKPKFEKIKLQYSRSEINSIKPNTVINCIKQLIN